MVRKSRFLFAVTLVAVAMTAPMAMAQRFLDPAPPATYKHNPGLMERCQGAVSLVNDVGVEGVRTTAWNFPTPGGGGESGRFDPTPVLQTKVELHEGCLNAHLSAIVGSQATYPASAPLSLFQVTVSQITPWGILPPQHLYGHYETPYGIYGPAVAIGAERDVDTFGANFFARVGTGPYDIPPGAYLVDVWWAGAGGPGGAIGAGFVLKLYQ